MRLSFEYDNDRFMENSISVIRQIFLEICVIGIILIVVNWFVFDETGYEDGWIIPMKRKYYFVVVTL